MNCRNYAMQLCHASLDKVFLKDEDPHKYRGPLPPKEEILFQLAAGMEYIHRKELVYTKANPRSVLIHVSYSSGDASGRNQEASVKWADFGLTDWTSKIPKKSSSLKKFGSAAEDGGRLEDPFLWMAPEICVPIIKKIQSKESSSAHIQTLIEDLEAIMKSQGQMCDIFSLGLVFSFVLLDGERLKLWDWIQSEDLQPHSFIESIYKKHDSKPK